MPVPSIRVLGDPVLRTSADPVRSYDSVLRRLVDTMFRAMYDADGAGLAAPQIGIGLRVFVYDVDGQRGHLVNPEITVADPSEVVDDEGCLSVPGAYYPMPRAAAVAVRGYDADGGLVEVRGSGMLARCFQHEVDHLDGVLYIDKLPPKLRREALLRTQEP